ncbi:hypothetical protein AAMO2058_000274900 [Amorphochlora amoebiformis]
MAENSFLLSKSESYDGVDIEAQLSVCSMFKESFSSLNTGEDLIEEMKDFGIDVTLLPKGKKIKEMTSEELEDYDKLLAQMDAALSKIQKQISRDKNSRSSKGEAKKSKGEDGKANCGNPTPSV